MHRTLKKIVSVSLSAIMALSVLTFVPADDKADSANVPLVVNDLNGYACGIKKTTMATTSSGYVRVVYDDVNSKLYVEEYNDDLVISTRREIVMELPIYGGFYSSSDAYYIAFGKNNTDEDTNAEVIRVVKYNKNFQRVSAAVIKGDTAFGHQVRYPFYHGNVSMTEVNGTLYLTTGHQGYVDPQYNMGHQGYLMIAINESNMTGKIVDADLWHSFSQHIKSKDSSNVYLFEESEGSRQLQLSKFNTSTNKRSIISVMDMGGTHTSAWAIPTYCQGCDLELSSTGVLCVGSSIDQSRYDDTTYTKTYNVLVTYTPYTSFTSSGTTLRWLSDLPAGTTIKDVKIAKISDDKFIVLWNYGLGDVTKASEDPLSAYTFYYCFINGKGEKIGDTKSFTGSLSECNPICKNGKIIFSSSTSGVVDFYTIDGNSGSCSVKSVLVAGTNATWSFDKNTGIVTISGYGAISDGMNYGGVQDKVTKIIVGEGINSIGKRFCYNLQSLKTVELPTTLKSISSESFYYCTAIEDLNIPYGVTSIPTRAFYGSRIKNLSVPDTVTDISIDAFYTGSYWISNNQPVKMSVKVYCTANSYAKTFFTQNNISTYPVSITVKDRTALYTGSPIYAGGAELKNLTGQVGYKYFSNAGCTYEIKAPTEPGKYYFKAYYLNNPSFPSLSSNPASITIKKDSSGGDILAFVGRLYTEVLGREAESDGLSYWTDELYNFRQSGAQVARGFTGSQELKDRNLNDTEFVAMLYKTFFDRSPDEEGYSYWMTCLGRGMDRNLVAESFIDSQEWADTCASYGILSGGSKTPSVSIKPNALTYGLVERMYTTAMKREYDSEGREFWASKLANYEMTGEEVGMKFFLSEEMENYKLSDSEYVERLYLTFMDRSSDAEGKAFWLDQLAHGFSREYVVSGFTRSPEFVERCLEARIMPYRL
ncbi:MAG: DUF4214 domain-containing protein [Clostridiales bacterium]|nr:DUF4214 domain-containing protein [Clostridiales bacterium]